MATTDDKDSSAAPAAVLATPTARGAPTVRASRAAREGRIKGWGATGRNPRHPSTNHHPNTPQNRHEVWVGKGHFAWRDAGTTPTRHPRVVSSGRRCYAARLVSGYEPL